MEEDYRRALELSFTCGYGRCVSKQGICGDQLEVPDCTPNSPNFLSPKCFASLRCSPVLASSEGVVAEVHLREVVEESGRGTPLGDLNGHPLFLLLFFFLGNGPNVAALLLPPFS